MVPVTSQAGRSGAVVSTTVTAAVGRSILLSIRIERSNVSAEYVTMSFAEFRRLHNRPLVMSCLARGPVLYDS